MALNDTFGAGNMTTIQNLVDDVTFISALIAKLKLGNGDNGVYTKSDIDAQLELGSLIAKLTADTDKAKKFYTQSAAETAFAPKGDVELDSLITKLTTDTDEAKKFYTQSAAKKEFATKDELNAKANAADVYPQNIVNDTFLKTDDLIKKVAEKAVVEAILGATDPDDASDPKKTILEKKVAEKAVVDGITGSADFTEKVYTKITADSKFAAKGDLEPAVLKTKVAHKDVVKQILKAEEDGHNIVVNELAKIFDYKGHSHPYIGLGESAPASSIIEDSPVVLDYFTNYL